MNKKNMVKFYIFLSFSFIFSIIFNFLKSSGEKTAFEIVNDMGIGYNLGNSFDCFDLETPIKTPDEQITLNNNPKPTKDLILKLKKYGFKTIRFPITWINFIDELGNINLEWLYRVKEVVTWITKAKMYCIINAHNDGDYGNWLSFGLQSKNKYINLWKQIANEFRDYDEYLIFESMNKPQYLDYYLDFDYQTVLTLSQYFVDTIRSSENMNKKRLLIISGPYADLDITSDAKFRMPIDPINKLAISIQYFSPDSFIFEQYYESFNSTNSWGETIIHTPDLFWGSDNDYNILFTDFNSIKSNFLDKNIPVIITATGVLTEEKKEIKSIREYLYAIFSLSTEYKGMMACLWDSSKNITHSDYTKSYDMNYYNREEDKWFDQTIQNIFLQISKGKFIKFSEYYIKSNEEILIEPNERDNYQVKVGNRKPLKIILNARLKGKLNEDILFCFYCDTNSGFINNIEFEKKNLKKEYDGTSTFTIDISNIDCFYIRVDKIFGSNDIIFNNLTIEFEDTFLNFDYRAYKNALEKFLN